MEVLAEVAQNWAQLDSGVQTVAEVLALAAPVLGHGSDRCRLAALHGGRLRPDVSEQDGALLVVPYPPAAAPASSRSR
ncbi:MAG: hypothetical protein U1F49_15335 [Rubrivivax sp.]